MLTRLAAHFAQAAFDRKALPALFFRFQLALLNLGALGRNFLALFRTLLRTVLQLGLVRLLAHSIYRLCESSQGQRAQGKHTQSTGEQAKRFHSA